MSNNNSYQDIMGIAEPFCKDNRHHIQEAVNKMLRTNTDIDGESKVMMIDQEGLARMVGTYIGLLMSAWFIQFQLTPLMFGQVKECLTEMSDIAKEQAKVDLTHVQAKTPGLFNDENQTRQ